MASRRHSTPRHPEPCKHCHAPVWIRATTRPGGLRAVTLPIDAAPDPDGPIAAPANGAHARFLAAGEQPITALAEQRFTPHRCPRDPDPASEHDQLTLIPATGDPQ